MAITQSVELSRVPVNIYANLTNGTRYEIQLAPGSSVIHLYETRSATAPDPEIIEKEKAYRTLAYSAVDSPRSITASASTYLWCWVPPGRGSALLAVE